MNLDAGYRQRRDDVEEGVCDFQWIAECHAFVFGSGREETLTHGGLPDDQTRPLLSYENIGFLDVG